MTNQIDIRQLEYFLVLAEVLHFGKAAKELLISQSALSQQIQRIEVVLGVQLFERTKRSVVLTDDGKLFKIEARAIVGQFRNSLERWQLSHGSSANSLKIGFVGSSMQVFLPSLMQKFTKKHPTIRFHLNELDNRSQLEKLQKQELDIGFIRSTDIPSTVRLKLVSRDNFCLVLPKNHAVSEANFKGLNQFKDASFILYPNDASNMYYRKIIDMCASYNFNPRVTHRSISGPTIFRLVELNLGISIVPESLINQKTSGVKTIILKNEPFKTELYAVWNKFFTNDSLKHFLEILPSLKI
ncbi:MULTISPECIES: LysR family transcriptional regulator [Flavobacteriaceae]|uniref:LysR family transcriptional regulator n=1 Tax=Flavobacteriaceae TaxID=49546 RepID=UPI0014921514|nr:MULTISPECIES: LysR family transcriptional regulator [Allomuricauda]MDC6367765.1 LysR family transcriptional regulator [Muricauda sp. AC10]